MTFKISKGAKPVSRIFTLAAIGLLSACTSGDVEVETGDTATILFDPVAGSAIVPFPNDAFFADSASTHPTPALQGFTVDTTLNIPNASAAPFVDNANLTDGFSTVASAFFDINGRVDLNTAVGAGAPFNPATDGVFIVRVAENGALLAPGPANSLINGLHYKLIISPLVARNRVLIQWLQPLQPNSQYAVVVSDKLKTKTGESILPTDRWTPVRVDADTTTGAGVVGVDPSNPPPADIANDPVKVGTLQLFQTQLIDPLLDGLANVGFDRNTAILAWTFTTQSIRESLDVAVGMASPRNPAAGQFAVAGAPFPDGTGGFRQATTNDFSASLPGYADVYIGFIEVPYYLEPAAATADPTPLFTFWKSDQTPAGGGATPSNVPNAPCGAFDPSLSTTKCFPTPVVQANLKIPVLMTIPNGSPNPAGGNYPTWDQASNPMVIVQHGITRDRTDAIGIADAMATAGIAVVAIDIPLHGITNPAIPIYRNGGAAAGPLETDERTFDLDLDGVAGTDASGTYFINLPSPITSRDNNRQHVSDLQNLILTLQAGISLPSQDGGANPVTLNFTGSVGYLGHSLGGILGGVFAGVNADATVPVSLAMPGGGIAKLLDGSPAFGPVVAEGLAANGVFEGTDTYETFLRFAQHLVDPGDPINYAVQANINHPVHMIEVVGNATTPPDLVVPNSVVANGSTVAISGPLSGTTPLHTVMGLDAVPVNPPASVGFPPSPVGACGPDKVMQFTAGDHGSIFDPTASLDALFEMQTQVVSFMANAGAVIATADGGAAADANCP